MCRCSVKSTADVQIAGEASKAISPEEATADEDAVVSHKIFVEFSKSLVSRQLSDLQHTILWVPSLNVLSCSQEHGALPALNIGTGSKCAGCGPSSLDPRRGRSSDGSSDP